MIYNVVAFLAGLSEPDRSAIRPDDLSSDWRVVYDERAGIMEYHAGLSRQRAEAEALAETIERIGPTYVSCWRTPIKKF